MTAEEHKAERLRAIAFHMGILVETLQEKGAITANGVQISLEMANELKAMANELWPEKPGRSVINLYREHLERLRQLRNQYGNIDYEGQFLDDDIARIEKHIVKLVEGATDGTDES